MSSHRSPSSSPQSASSSTYSNGTHQRQSPPSSYQNSPLSSPSRRSSSTDSVSRIPLPPGSPPASVAIPTVFPAIAVPSKKGIHPVYQYRIPGTDLVYEFQFQRVYKNVPTYICSGCKAIPIGSDPRVGHTSARVKVINGNFEKNPCLLSHVCQPRKTSLMIADRIGYELARDIRSNPAQFVGKNPKDIYTQTVKDIKRTDFGADVDCDSVKRAFTRGEHHRHRSSFSRALNVQDGAKISFDDVPSQYQKIDDDVFLQLKTNDIHIFYRKSTLKLAVKAGLHTIICDGVHSLHPSELGRKAQLYGLHGVCGNAQAKPLVYVTSINKLTSTYLTIFEHVASRLEKYGAKIHDINVILDFENAAHRAAGQIFNKDRVVGCLFHFGMALARNAHYKGLSPFTEGSSENSDIIRWLDQLRALPFLPATLISKVDALRALPVRPTHPAYSACKDFIEYFKSQWMSPEVRYKWNKWLVFTDRTTNLAEAWHRSLTDSIRCQHPSYHVLIQKLMDEEEACNNFLYNRVVNGQPTRPLRKRDAQRRDAVAEAMIKFNAKISHRSPTPNQVAAYLEEMSCFVSTKRN
ncbi:hypothetical protein WR25_15806 [Diploscapter pachys]|uniref:MULE transposase domain-containing protein n=1 Tax=Diploscapter pachys TaxID=2018661 RepID=A0A2A2L8C5_9BILA|nr:hypothetical protein WR25_15806 [Diploscapter pachys]